jgi:hypothetical protein
MIRMLNQKSVLARLLANENITVDQGNHQTAFFDVEKRELGLPLWKDMSKDLYDLLVGHEVGHALETPVDFPEQIAALEIPHTYLNIVEDIRIEKKILAKYPGLVANFKRGYKEMFFDRDLFEVAGKDLGDLMFMDRLNIKAKGRDQVDVPFSAEEMPYVQKAMAVDTFEDVIRVCIELVAWLKAQKKTETQSKDGSAAPGQNDDQQDGSEEQDEMQMSGEEAGEEEGEEEGEAGEGEEEGEAGEGEEEDKKGPVGTSGADGDTDDIELEEAETVEAFDRNQSSLVEKGVVVAKGMSREMFNDLVVPYSEIAKNRRAVTNSRIFPIAQWNKFQTETKQVVNLMVKDFEMRKQAHRTLRARTSTKGSLDVNKLHSYKYDDNLFKQVTALADAKNHGMIMLVDYSGSMYGVLSDVIRQTLALIMFCKRVNIPFEVYSFTTPRNECEDRLAKKFRLPGKAQYACEGLVLNQILSSSMSKREYDEATKMFFWRSVAYSVYGATEALGSTPLNEALMAMQYVISDFRKKYNVEKLNFIALTDGESNHSTVYNSNGGIVSHTDKVMVEVNGKYVEVSAARYGEKRKITTENLLAAISDRGVKTVNFFVCEKRSARGVLNRSGFTWMETKEKTREMFSKGVLVLDKNDGYDRRFIIPDTSLKDNTIDLNFNEDASTKTIAKAFAKSSGSKKSSRLLTQKFSEIIA